jgi:hypothetical protein
MAWTTVRNLIEGWLTAAPVKFYPTINNEIEPVADPVWSTVMFGFSGSEVISFCRDRAEQGTFTVVVYGEAGKGWAAVIKAAEDIRDYLMAQADPAKKFEISNYTSPIEFTAGSAMPLYGAEIIYDYTLF